MRHHSRDYTSDDPMSNMQPLRAVGQLKISTPLKTICRAGFASRGYQGLRKPPPLPSHLQRTPAKPPKPPPQAARSSSTSNAVSDALRDTKPEDNSLLVPVHIPEDPDGILNEKHPAATILGNSAIVVQRELEMMNIMIGFEQANRYVIMDPQGNHLGFMAEQEFGTGNMMARQMFKTHRSFTTHVFDKHRKEVLRVGWRPSGTIHLWADLYSSTDHLPTYPHASGSTILWMLPPVLVLPRLAYRR